MQLYHGTYEIWNMLKHDETIPFFASRLCYPGRQVVLREEIRHSVEDMALVAMKRRRS